MYETHVCKCEKFSQLKKKHFRRNVTWLRVEDFWKLIHTNVNVCVLLTMNATLNSRLLFDDYLHYRKMSRSLIRHVGRGVTRYRIQSSGIELWTSIQAKRSGSYDEKCGISNRTFVSLNDLAKLTPFGSSPKQNGKESSSSPRNTQSDDGYTETVILPFSRDHLFSIVSDVAAYEEFVPYCIQSRILSSNEASQFLQSSSKPQLLHGSSEEFLAELTVGFGSLKEQYISKVFLDREKGQIIAEAIPTPLFQHLRTSWTVQPLSPNQSKVDFEVHYAFSNPFYAAMAKAAMQKMASQMIGAFEKRAVEQAS